MGGQPPYLLFIYKISLKYRVWGSGHIFGICLYINDFFAAMASGGLVLEP